MENLDIFGQKLKEVNYAMHIHMKKLKSGNAQLTIDAISVFSFQSVTITPNKKCNSKERMMSDFCCAIFAHVEWME